jgi:hypothetical protein
MRKREGKRRRRKSDHLELLLHLCELLLQHLLLSLLRVRHRVLSRGLDTINSNIRIFLHRKGRGAADPDVDSD